MMNKNTKYQEKEKPFYLTFYSHKECPYKLILAATNSIRTILMPSCLKSHRILLDKLNPKRWVVVCCRQPDNQTQAYPFTFPTLNTDE